MPELPEVETMRRGILPILGGRISEVQIPAGPFRPIRFLPSSQVIRERAWGTEISGIDRRGKRILVRLNSGDTLVFEPRMTGLVVLSDPPDHDHLRIGFRLDHVTYPWLWFWDRRGLGGVAMWTNEEVEEHLGANRLGPDALEVDLVAFRSRFAGVRQPIKVALLDQRKLAGIGNLYASEILFAARIHPQVPCDALSRLAWRRIFNSMRSILQEAIAYEGSTLSDGTYRNALNQAGSYQNHHHVYDRAGEVCSTCRRVAIERIVQAQRATFFCPRCQLLRV